MSDNPVGSTEQQRAIRIFISSTFRDMKEEREELVKRVFPLLRKLCEKRGVTWGTVDLRWGITDEQQAEGEVLPICLREIHECRPFLIGILGERYGWVPPEVPDELIEQEPWLAEDHGRSVAELELLHGVLNNPDKAEHAYFYFRDPAYVESLPAERQDEFRECPTPEEIEEFGSEEADRRAEDRRGKLAALKDRIRNSGLPVRENYSEPKQLGTLVLRDLTELIDRLFPEGEEPDPLNQEAAEHEAYARSRFKVYIGREEYFNRLNTHVQGDGPPLVVLGESGSGKSALLANWAAEHREQCPDDFLIVHFIGATPYSSDWAAMLRRIMGELKLRFEIQDEIPTELNKLIPVFANWLHMASAAAKKRGEKIVLILDALNQLEDKDSALDLVWLPPAIPENIRLILSTLPGRPLDYLKKREWPTMDVKPLADEERKELIEKYLEQYRKTLSEKRVERIASSKQTSNPLFLRTLLEELRVFGVHHYLDRAIEYYLLSRSAPGLFERILRRLEQDYEREWPGLVEDAMTFVWASRRGLSEEELLDLLGVSGNALPRGQWVQFSTAVEKLIINRSGFINFAHGYIRKAIQDRYLREEEARKAAHERLADYFSDEEINPRKVDELPWQLAEAADWKRLYDLLANLEFFREAWEENQFEVKRYWSKIEASSPLRLLKAYQPVLDEPDRVIDKDLLMDVSLLLADTRHLSEVLSLFQFLAESYRQSGDRKKLGDCLRDQARIFFNRGDLEQAMALLKEQEQISRELDDPDGLSRALGNQAVVHLKRGDMDAAMALHKEEERICRELGDANGLYRCLGNQALIHKGRGELDRAMELQKEVERICRELGDPGGLSRSIGNQALILKMRGDLDPAIRLLEERERICRELGDPDGLQRSIGNQASISIEKGNLDGAMELAKEQERICREIDNPEGLSHALVYQADVLARKGQAKDALLLAEEAYRLATKHKYASLAKDIEPILEKIHALLE